MKKTMVYILALSMLAVTLLAGCGETGDNRNDMTGTPNATDAPGTDIDLVPDMLEPDTDDGRVNDTDGIITDGDNGGSGATSGTGTNGNNGMTNGTASGAGTAAGNGTGTTTGTGTSSRTGLR